MSHGAVFVLPGMSIRVFNSFQFPIPYQIITICATRTLHVPITEQAKKKKILASFYPDLASGLSDFNIF